MLALTEVSSHGGAHPRRANQGWATVGVVTSAPSLSREGAPRSRRVYYCGEWAPPGGLVGGGNRRSHNVGERGGQGSPRCQGEGRGFESRRPLQKPHLEPLFGAASPGDQASRSTNSVYKAPA